MSDAEVGQKRATRALYQASWSVIAWKKALL